MKYSIPLLLLFVFCGCSSAPDVATEEESEASMEATMTADPMAETEGTP